MLKKLIILILFVHKLVACDLNQTPQNQNNYSLSPREYQVQKVFLTTLLNETEAGYVLHGDKPVCWTGFRSVVSFHPGMEDHSIDCALREGAKLWRRKGFSARDGNFIILHTMEEDPDIPDTTQLLCINKVAFLEVVKKNIHLFQYVLGPATTPENLLDEILNPQNFFSQVLRNDRVLIGILLG